MKPDLTPFLGRAVRVVVDRPLGSRHPRWPELGYPVNYGELPGTLSGDGHPIDAYLLGWDEPVREASGVVTAVILRADDVEDKLVVAPPGARWSDAEIMKAVWFQEQYFETRLMR
ncbi:inorganic pyrophosphatase [Deinococcus metallilatus]|uniref:inorganic diphosphatase n=1 Tax=Deinococcus metallilatus TaxID=1211322 RepID=A0AAJ5F396_9DEIO|nr:inorganic diphosphatase [Deinococcus metallilatus]MBB5294283.1 inorganic pyrophosphatase [Deinococcus metallilatus]QBY09058.1 inorganic pyrophosphatase [Deinococcus metallilatus]RXJ10202.1 inorganic pyrophosphatase [Deinococcus metallilatus]TLK27861.1 inorganic pyrophosphatase [Deinococcus metallilatus]GMA16381.1 inorganic pyrophosphatase [Deinococcus metallilatus]